MDKKQAAEFLNVSPRTLERYTTQGKISVGYKQGKTGAEAVYDKTELQRFKDELENRSFPARPAVESPATTIQSLATTTRDTGLTEAVGSASARLSDAFEVLAEAIQHLKNGEGKGAPAVTLGEKIMLTVQEASALTSLSRNHLFEAIHAGKLKAKIIGRGWRVKRTDLDAYVKKL
jgi:excisionase family DNA binding protein